MHLTFTSPHLSHPPVGGPELRIVNSVKALRRVADLEIVPQQPLSESTRDFLADLQVPIAPLPGPWATIARITGRPQWRTRGLARHLIELSTRRRSCAIWFGYGNISYPLMAEVARRDPSKKLVCDTDSVWSRFVRRELEVEGDPGRQREIRSEAEAKEREERAWVEMCHATTAVSEVDAAYYRELAPDPQRIHVFSNGIDTRDYAEPAAAPPGFRGPALFLGGSFYSPSSPMAHATRWVLDEVMPRLRGGGGHTPHLYVVGRGSDALFLDRESDDVSVLGEVPSVLPYLSNSAASLVPLFFESGTRFKILEAGALGVPVVTTTLGAEGIPVTHGVDALVADDADAFAAAVADACSNPSRRDALGSSLRDLVTEKYGIGALADQARSVLDHVCGLTG